MCSWQEQSRLDVKLQNLAKGTFNPLFPRSGVMAKGGNDPLILAK
jgi:hypothetical protein